MDDEDGFTTTPAPRHNPVLSFTIQNVALLIPIIGALIFAFRCVIVSEGDVYVAFILAAQTSIGDAIRALLFTVIPVLLFASALVAAFASSTRLSYGGWRDYRTLGIGIAAAGLSAALSIGWLYLSGGFRGTDAQPSVVFISLFPYMSVGPLARELRGLRMRKGGMKRPVPVFLASFAAAGVASLVFILLGPSLADKTFWLPRERLVFQKEAPFTGYVLKASEDNLIILNDHPRIVIEKPISSLKDRDFCYPEDHKAQSSKLAADSPACP